MRTKLKLSDKFDLEFSVRNKQKYDTMEILTNNEFKFSDHDGQMNLHYFTVYGTCFRAAATLKILFKTAKIETF